MSRFRTKNKRRKARLKRWLKKWKKKCEKEKKAESNNLFFPCNTPEYIGGHSQYEGKDKPIYHSPTISQQIEYQEANTTASQSLHIVYYFAENSHEDIEALFYPYAPTIIIDNRSNIKLIVVDENVNTTVTSITDGELCRIYNAAYKIKSNITLVGSRANGTPTPMSDWDYIIEEFNNKKWKKIKNSLPGAKTDDCPIRNIDIIRTPIDENKPYITVSPSILLNKLIFGNAFEYIAN